MDVENKRYWVVFVAANEDGDVIFTQVFGGSDDKETAKAIGDVAMPILSAQFLALESDKRDLLLETIEDIGVAVVENPDYEEGE